MSALRTKAAHTLAAWEELARHLRVNFIEADVPPPKQLISEEASYRERFVPQEVLRDVLASVEKKIEKSKETLSLYEVKKREPSQEKAAVGKAKAG